MNHLDSWQTGCKTKFDCVETLRCEAHLLLQHDSALLTDTDLESGSREAERPWASPLNPPGLCIPSVWCTYAVRWGEEPFLLCLGPVLLMFPNPRPEEHPPVLRGAERLLDTGRWADPLGGITEPSRWPQQGGAIVIPISSRGNRGSKVLRSLPQEHQHLRF